jgi:MFS transporter, CP family, cyanate transporter
VPLPRKVGQGAVPAQLSLRRLVPFFMVALSMRAGIACVPAVLVYIENDHLLSASTAGVLVALPVLCYGLCGPVGALLARVTGLRNAVLVCLVAMTVGAGMRIGVGAAWLWVGTVVLALGVAFGNVLMPAVIRATFPDHVGTMTGAYAAAIGLGASLSAGLTVPITQRLGGDWHLGIGVWALLSAAAVVVWASSRTRSPAHPPDITRMAPTRLLRNPLAWQVTLIMGMQSLQYQALASWLPTIYADHGLSVGASGFQLSLYTLLGIPASFFMSAVVAWCGCASIVVVGVSLLNLIGLLGLLLAPAASPVLWSCILGVSQGAAVSLALMFIAMRARSTSTIAQLSAMAQSIGYGIAFLGPLLLGWLHSIDGSWTTPILVLLVSLAGMTWSGVLASRDRFVDDEGQAPVGDVSEASWPVRRR